MNMTPELRKHYAKLGKLGREAVNKKYSVSVRREWARRGGRPKKIHVMGMEKETVRRLKHAVRKNVKYALKIGKLKKEPCSICGDVNVQAHHNDYSKPLEVAWVCQKHHSELDKKFSTYSLDGENKKV